MSDFSRRDFLKTAALGSVGMVAASQFLSSPAMAEPVGAYKYGDNSGMKITKVTAYPCGSRWCFVRVDTDAGIHGWGECGAWAWQTATAEVVKILETLLIGKDPFKIEWLWNAMMRTPHFRGIILNAAISAIDIALWDIKGKACGVPVWELLGGRIRDKIRCYETTSGKTPEEVANNVQKLVDEGWKHIRLRPLSDNRSDTVAALCTKNEAMFKAVREKVGYGVDLSIEMHRQCKPIEAIELGKRLDPYMVHFIEDPFNDYPEVARDVSKRCPAPIANGERSFNIYELAWLVDNTDVAYLRPDMCTIGGITAGMKIARIAEAKNVHIVPHNPLGPISTMAALQIDSVVPNFEVQEWPSGNWADYITTEDIRIENGYAILPGGPGLGVNIVDDVDVKFPFGGRKPSWTVHEDGSIVDR